MGIPLAIAFANLLGLALIYPLLPFMALDLGLAAGFVPLILMVDTLATVLLAPLWGSLSDRIGRRAVLVPVLAAGPLSFLLLAVADHLAILLASRLLSGIAYAAMPVIQAQLADRTSSQRRVSAMAGFNFAYSLAFVTGGLFVHLALDKGLVSNAHVAVIAAAIATAAPLLAFTFLRGDGVETRGAPSPARVPSVWSKVLIDRATLQQALLPTLAIFAVGFAYATMETTIGVWSAEAYGWGPGEFALVFVAGGAAAVVSQLYLATQVRSLPGERAAAGLGMAGLFGGLTLLSLAPEAHWVYVASACMGAGTTTALSCLQSMVSRRGSEASQGRVLGVAQSGLSLAFILGPIWGGFALDQLGAAAPFLSGCVFLILPFVIFSHAVRGEAGQAARRLSQEN